jgi:hypothetical protein
MIRALFRGIKRVGRLGFRLGIVVGLFALINQLLRRGSEPEAETTAPSSGTRAASPPQSRPPSSAPTPATATRDDPQPEPQTAPPAATSSTDAGGSATTTGLSAWVEAEQGACPVTHPVKAKVASKIFHEPGMLAYERTTPDRCYRDAAAAEADGFRRAKR